MSDESNDMQVRLWAVPIEGVVLVAATSAKGARYAAADAVRSYSMDECGLYVGPPALATHVDSEWEDALPFGDDVPERTCAAWLKDQTEAGR